MGWLIAIMVVITLGLIAWGVWGMYNHITNTNNERRMRQLQVQRTARENQMGRTIKQDISINENMMGRMPLAASVSEVPQLPVKEEGKFEKLEKLAKMKSDGHIDDEEYKAMKAEILK